MSATPKLRIGIVGLGMAGSSMVDVLLAHPHMTIAGAADPNPELRERFAQDYGVGVCADAETLCRREDLDALYIASPHQFHKEHAVSAATHGKHAIVEKPMALNLADCDAMLDAAARHNTVLMAGYTHGFDPAVRLIRSFVGGGDYGRLAMIASLNYTDFLYRPRRAEELDTAKGGGILFNQIPHQVDMLRVMANEPVRSVRAMAGVLDPRRATEGCASAFLEFRSGATATLVYSGYDHFDSDELHHWVGERGRVKTPDQGAARRRLAGMASQDDEAQARVKLGYTGNAAPQARQSPPAPHQPHFGMLVVSCERADFRPSLDGVTVYHDDGPRHVELPPLPPHAGRMTMLNDFHAAVSNGRSPLHNGQFGRDTLEVCLAVMRSARDRREVFL